MSDRRDLRIGAKATLVLRRDHEERVVNRGIHGAPDGRESHRGSDRSRWRRRFPHRELPEDTADNRGPRLH